MKRLNAIAIGIVTLLVMGCPPAAPPVSVTPDAETLTVPGLENAFRVSPNLYSGGTPEGDAAYAELQKLGVKTIISVDGAEPDVAIAAKHGLKYVHIPVGYDGISQTQAFRLARAVQSLPGPVYVHCHHGKHRGPAAVAAVRLCLEGEYSPAAARGWLEKAGTSADYPGLIRLPNSLKRPTLEQLAAIPAEFPERAPVKDLTKVMVHIDAYWDTILAARKKNWLGADSAAVLLAEEYHDAERTLTTGTKGEGFSRMLLDAEATARQLAAAIKAGNLNDAPALFEKCKAQCTACHARFRN